MRNRIVPFLVLVIVGANLRANPLAVGVAIARALITRPAIILADEPTGNLDTTNSDAVLAMLRRSNQEFKQTVLMITHNPEAAAIGDRILHMRDGHMLDA